MEVRAIPAREPEKLVDLATDPEERTDLSGNPEYAGVLARLMAPVDEMPEVDADPRHGKLEPQSWWQPSGHKTKRHKK